MPGNIAKRANGRWRARYRDDQGARARAALRPQGRRAALARRGHHLDRQRHLRRPRAGDVTFAGFYADWSVRQLWVRKTRENADLAARSVPFARPTDEGHPPLARRGVDQGHDRRPRTDHHQDALRDRPLGVPSRRASTASSSPTPPTGVTLPRRRRADAAMTVPTAEAGRPAAAPRRQPRASRPARGSAPTSHSAPSPASASARPPAYSSATSTSSSASSTSPASYSAKATPTSSAHRSTAPSASSTCPTSSSTSSPSHVQDAPPSEPATGPVALHGGRRADVRQRRHLALARHPQRRRPRPIRLHDLRHFYASGLIADGCDVVTVQRSLGHATATTTLNTYSHLWPTAEDRTRAAASRLARAALGL